MPRKSARIAKRKSARIAKYRGHLAERFYQMEEYDVLGLHNACLERVVTIEDVIGKIKLHTKEIEHLRKHLKGLRKLLEISRPMPMYYAGQMRASNDTVAGLETCLRDEARLADHGTVEDLKTRSNELTEMLRLLRNKKTSLESEINRLQPHLDL